MSQRKLGSILNDPVRAAIFAALIGLFAKWVNNRMLKKEDDLPSYLKFMAYSAGLVGGIIFSINKKRGSGSSSSSSSSGYGTGFKNVAKQFGMNL